MTIQRPPIASELQLVLCHTCKKASSSDALICSRCGATFTQTQANSLVRTWSLLITGLLCYVPANLLPVMRTDIVGNGRESTIMSGVLELLEGRGMGHRGAHFYSQRCSALYEVSDYVRVTHEHRGSVADGAPWSALVSIAS